MATSLNDNDVLLGRGLGVQNYTGNQRFQSLIKTRKQEYMSLTSSKKKKVIAEALYYEIERRGGRFLSAVDDGEWEEVPKKVGLEKVKQALRERKWLKGEDNDQKPASLPMRSNASAAPQRDLEEDEYDSDAVAEALARESMPDINASSSLDELIPVDSLQFLDVDSNEESGDSLVEMPTNLSPILPSMLDNGGPYSLDAPRLTLFQAASQLSFQQLLLTNPGYHSTEPHWRVTHSSMYDDLPPSATNRTDTMPISGTAQASFPTTNPQFSLRNTLPIGESTSRTDADACQRVSLPLNQDLSESLFATIGFGGDQPRFTAQDEEQEMAALTDEENAARLMDLFGKKCSLDIPPHQKRQKRAADERTMAFLVHQMRNEIERMPKGKKAALMKAREKCREEEFSDLRFETFLRSEGMNAKLAAERFVEYWSCRRELFGPYKFTMRMTLSEALRDDLVALQSGYHCLLPRSDGSGRRIVFRDPSQHTRKGYSSDSAVRAFWYLVEIIVREPGYDGGGFVLIAWLKRTTMWDFDRQGVSKLIHYIHNALPVKAMPSHGCCPGLVLLRIVKPILYSLMSRTERIRNLLHDVAENEILESLSPYGLETSMLPTEMGGTVELNITEWIANRRAIEMEEI